MNLFLQKTVLLFKWYKQQKVYTKIIIILLLIVISWFTYTKITSAKSKLPQYQTATAEKGSIIVTVSASGIVSAANSA